MFERILQMKRSLIALICFMFCSTGMADQVFLNNGDMLTGTIVQLTDSTMIFKSELAGEVKIALADIRTIASDKLLTIHLKDGTVLHCQVSASQGSQFEITNSTVQSQTLNTADITAINPPAKSKPKWEGQISGGITSTHGNTKSDNHSFSFRAKKRTEIDRITVNADYAKGVQENTSTGLKSTTEDWWRTKAKYDYFVSEKWYGYLDGRYERDGVADLDRRMVIGLGAGWQWIETSKTQMSFELGAASLYEKFDTQNTSNSELSLQMGYNLEHKLMDSVQFIHDLTYFPSTEKFSNYYLTTSAELRAHFSSRMFANFKTLFNYDASPATGKGNTDIKYILGVGLDF